MKSYGNVIDPKDITTKEYVDKVQSSVPSLINDALKKAKDSGEFKGDPGDRGLQGIQGWSIVAQVNRDNNLTDSQWKSTYAATGHTETWGSTSSIRNGCRVGDLFMVSGITSDTKNNYVAFYRSTTSSGDLKGTCIGSVCIPKGQAGTNGTNGTNGLPGTNGKTWKPTVDGAGNLTWTQDSSTSKPASQNIKGPAGKDGLTTSVQLGTGLIYTQDKGKIILPAYPSKPEQVGAAPSGHNHNGAYLAIAGGTLTGNLTGQYITATWLRSTKATNTGNSATKIAVFDSNGWLYYRTPSQILSDIGAASTGHTHDSLQTGSSSVIPGHPGERVLKFSSRISSETIGLFDSINNANAIITMNKHDGSFDSQLGFSSNGNIYYRNFNSEDNYATKGWEKILTSNNYQDYAPSKTGTGASGNWGINITGKAGSVAWGNVTGKPGSYPPSSHTHDWSNITGSKPIFDWNTTTTSSPSWIPYWINGTKIGAVAPGNLSVKYAASAGSVAWGNVTGKPDSYPPSSHTHSYLPLSGGTLTGALKVNETICAYAYGVSNNKAAFTADKPGTDGFGIGANGSNMTIQYGQVSNLSTGSWSSSQNIIHDFKGTLRNNGNNVITTSNIGSQSVSNAGYLRDKTYGTASYLDYGASALSNPTYLAGWDGYTLRAVNRSNLSVGEANRINQAVFFNRDDVSVQEYAEARAKEGFRGNITIQLGDGAKGVPTTYCMGQITMVSGRVSIVLFAYNSIWFNTQLEADWSGWRHLTASSQAYAGWGAPPAGEFYGQIYYQLT